MCELRVANISISNTSSIYARRKLFAVRMEIVSTLAPNADRELKLHLA